jgi:transposase
VLYSAPEELRAPPLGHKTKALVAACATLRPGPITSTTAATKATMRILARRWRQLQAELTQLDAQLQELVSAVAPTLVALPGVGSTPPASCWSPPATTPAAARRGRLRPPVRRLPDPGVLGSHRSPPAESGGDPHANNALWRIALVRMRCHPPTRAYVERRTNQGLSKLDIMGCLKRYIAREVYHHLTDPPTITPATCPKQEASAPAPARPRQSGTPGMLLLLHPTPKAL